MEIEEEISTKNVQAETIARFEALRTVSDLRVQQRDGLASNKASDSTLGSAAYPPLSYRSRRSAYHDPGKLWAFGTLGVLALGALTFLVLMYLNSA